MLSINADLCAFPMQRGGEEKERILKRILSFIWSKNGLHKGFLKLRVVKQCLSQCTFSLEKEKTALQQGEAGTAREEICLLSINTSAHIICAGVVLPTELFMETKEKAVLQQPSECAAAGESQREEKHALFTRNLLNLQEEGAGGHM